MMAQRRPPAVFMVIALASIWHIFYSLRVSTRQSANQGRNKGSSKIQVEFFQPSIMVDDFVSTNIVNSGDDDDDGEYYYVDDRYDEMISNEIEGIGNDDDDSFDFDTDYDNYESVDDDIILVEADDDDDDDNNDDDDAVYFVRVATEMENGGTYTENFTKIRDHEKEQGGMFVERRNQQQELLTINIQQYNSNKPITNIRILGERHSSTTHHTKFLSKCFPKLKVSNFFTTSKHWFQRSPEYIKQVIDEFGPDTVKDRNKVPWEKIARTPNAKETIFADSLVLVLVRDPYQWMEAMRKIPHHWPNHVDFTPNKDAIQEMQEEETRRQEQSKSQKIPRRERDRNRHRLPLDDDAAIHESKEETRRQEQSKSQQIPRRERERHRHRHRHRRPLDDDTAIHENTKERSRSVQEIDARRAALGKKKELLIKLRDQQGDDNGQYDRFDLSIKRIEELENALEDEMLLEEELEEMEEHHEMKDSTKDNRHVGTLVNKRLRHDNEITEHDLYQQKLPAERETMFQNSNELLDNAERQKQQMLRKNLRRARYEKRQGLDKQYQRRRLRALQPAGKMVTATPLEWNEFVSRPMYLLDENEPKSTHKLCQKSYLINTISPCDYTSTYIPSSLREALSFRPRALFASVNDVVYELHQNFVSSNDVGTPFQHPLELRSAKIANILDIPNQWDLGGFGILNQEVLMINPSELIQQISDITGMDPRCPSSTKKPHTKNPYELPIEFVDWITKNADWELEEQIGYFAM